MSASCRGLVAACVALLAGKAVGAAPALEMAIDPCVGLAGDQVRGLLDVELATLARDRRLPAGARVAVTCAERHLVIAVSDPLTGRSSAALLAVEDLPSAALPRLLALSISERLAPLWTAEPALAARTEPAPAPLPPASPSWRLLPGLGLRSFPGKGLGPAWGGGVALERRFAYLHFGVDSSLAVAEQQVSLGRARVLLLDGALQVGGHARTGAWGFGLDLGVRLGLARLSGLAGDRAVGQAFTRALGGPLLAGTVSRHVSQGTLLCLALEVGTTVRDVVGTVAGAPDVTVGGPWLGISLRWGFQR